MSEQTLQEHELAVLENAVARLRASVMAVVFGMASGFGLAIATAWLVIQGGYEVGLHLGLLGNYFPGYTVSWSGVFIGFVYGALSGAAVGWVIAWLYNWIADSRS